MSSAADRNLLFGILAVQMDFVSREQLIAAMNAWVLEKNTPLGQILLREKAIGADELELLEALVAKHLSRHGNDPEKSLAAVSSIESVRDQLKQLADPEVEASLAQVSQDRNRGDPLATLSVGESTSAGQRFRILRPHAKGGLGEVFVATDDELRREVALKQIQPHRADDPNSRSRFLLEAEITGGLEHPGIVPVYGLGTYADGRPFYAMRFIRGDSLKDAIERFHCAGTPKVDQGERTLEFRKLLGRFIDVCNAIEYAHSRGVLHRDLKPGNIMLGKYGETLVVDWGLAKTVGRSEPSQTDSGENILQPSSASGSAPTQMGSAIGTPQYMSPEQAAGRLDQLGPHSDIYGLGATLYCLLAGQAPLAGIDHLGEILRRVERGDIRPPRQLSQESNLKFKIPKPLEAICLKAMALKPADRYPSPRVLADDLEHWLADEPIAAQVDTLPQHLARWSRQHRAVVRAAAAAVLLVAVVSTVAAVLVNRARQEADGLATKNLALANREIAAREHLHAQTVELNRQLALNLFERGCAQFETGDPSQGMALLAGAYNRAPDGDPLRTSIANVLGGWRQSAPICLLHRDAIGAIAFSPDGSTVLTGSDDCTARLWDSQTGRSFGEPMKHDGKIKSVAFSPDGTMVITGSDDCTARLWNARTGKPQSKSLRHGGIVHAVAFSPDGSTVVTVSSDYTARLWDARTGKPLAEPMKHASIVLAVAFGPDGSTVLTGSNDHTARLWNARTGKPVGEPMNHDGSVHAVAFSPDGTTVLTGSDDGTAQLWNARTGKPLGAPMKHDKAVEAVAFSPDGSRVLTGSADQSARLWDAQTGKPLSEPMKHDSAVNAVAFSPDGSIVLTGGYCTAQLWDARSGKSVRKPLRVEGWCRAVAFSPDGSSMLAGSDDARLWTRTHREVGQPMKHESFVSAAVFSPDGSLVLTGSDDRTARLWDARTGKLRAEPMKHEGSIRAVAFSPDGSTVLTGSWDNTARLWDARTGKSLCEPMKLGNKVNAVAFSPNGSTMLTGDMSTTRLWDARTGKAVGEPMPQAGGFYPAVFSADGSTVLTGSGSNLGGGGSARLWDARTGKPVGEPMEHASGIVALAFSADGAMVFTEASDHARVWDARTCKPMGQPIKHDNLVVNAAFNPEGSKVLTVNRHHIARLWDARMGTPVGEPMKHDGSVGAVAFSPDGSTVLTGSSDHTARFWDLRTGKPLCEPIKHDAGVGAVAFSPNGSMVLTGSEDDTARLWDAPRSVPGRQIRLLSAAGGLRLGESGEFEHVTDEQLAELWKQLESDGADWLADQAKAERRHADGWHRRQAAEAETSGDWFAAEFHLKWLVAREPADANLTVRRDRAHAEFMKQKAERGEAPR